MNYPESHMDLLQSAGVGVFTTVGKDGLPQSTAVWYMLDDDSQMKISLASSRQKLRNLQSNPACNLYLIDFRNPYRAIEIRANAELIKDEDLSFRNKVSRHYGVDLADFDGPEDIRWIVVLTPVKLNTIG